VASFHGASYAHAPDWKPGPMAPPPAYQYTMIGGKKKRKWK